MVFQGFVNYYNAILAAGDPRSAVFPFVKDPIYIACAAVIYLMIVIVGPRFMVNRNALKLREVLIGYNFLSVLLSIWVMWEVR